MRLFTPKTVLVVLIPSLVLTLACTDAPKQKDRSKPPAVEHDINQFKPYIELSGEESRPQQKDLDDVVRINVKKPITYGQTAEELSVAGVNLAMSAEEASAVLSDPLGGLATDGSRVAYKESLYAFYSPQKPHRLYEILLFQGYKGKLQALAPIGTIGIGSNFSQYLKKDPSGQLLAQVIYKSLTGQECPKNKCKAFISADNLLHILDIPHMKLMISKGSGNLFAMGLNFVESLKLAEHSFDLAQLSFTDKSTNQPVLTLGTKWGKVQKEAPGVNGGLTIVNAKEFGKAFNSLALITSRSKYNMNYKKPDENELLKGVMLKKEYKQALKINGQFINLSVREKVIDDNSSYIPNSVLETHESRKNVELYPVITLDKNPGILPITPGITLNNKELFGTEEFKSLTSSLLLSEEGIVISKPKINTDSFRRAFVIELTKAIEGELKKLYSTVHVVKSGDNTKTGEIILGRVFFTRNGKTKKQKPFVLSIDFSLSKGQVNRVLVGLETEPVQIERFNKKDLNVSIRKGIDGRVLPMTEISGVKLKETIHLSEKSELDQAATLKFLDRPKKPTIRGGWYINKFLPVAFHEKLPFSHPSVTQVTFGPDALDLFLRPTPTRKKNEYTVVGISSSVVNKVTGLCGQEDVELHIGMTDEAVFDILKKFRDSGIHCPHKLTESVRGSGQITAITFTDSLLAIDFNDRVVSLFTIYSEELEVGQ